MKAFLIQLKKIDGFLARVFGYVIALFVFGQLVILFAGVIARYFFNAPFVWSDELASLLLVMITFLGGYTALVQNKLARVTMAVDKCPPIVKRLLTILCNLAMLVMMAIVFLYSVKMIGTPVVAKQSTATLRIPMIYIYACMPVSFGLMFFHTLVDTLNLFFGGAASAPREEGGFAS